MTQHEYQVSMATAQGAREYQEDRSAVAPVGEPVKALAVVVCDGVGGYPRGDEAAEKAVEAFLHNIDANIEVSGMAVVIDKMQDAVMTLARKPSEGAYILTSYDMPPSTTFVGAVFKQDRLICGSVGDSHIYRIRNQGMVRINPLHETPHGGLTSMLGGAFRKSEAFEARAFSGDILLFASDGLDFLRPELVVEEALKPDSTAQDIVNRVIAVGHEHQDNVTVVMVKVK